MAIEFIARSSLVSNPAKDPTNQAKSNKHQRFKLDVEGKYHLLGPSDSYQDLLGLYGDILGKEVKDISKLSYMEVCIILNQVGGKLY